MDLSLSSLLSSFKKETAPTADRVVGIDIGSASVKVVELEMGDKAPILRTYGELQLGPYVKAAIGENVTLEGKERVEAVVDVMREAGVVASHGTYALPLSGSFIAFVPVVLGKNETFEDRLPVLARKYIPVPVAEVALDWIMLPENEATPDAPQEALLVAVQNDVLRRSKELLGAIDMVNEPAELEIFSAMRGVQESSPLYAMLDIGAQYCRFYIIQEEVLVRMHRVTVGGAEVTKHIAVEKNISFEQAEEFKRFSTTDEEDSTFIKQATTAVLESPLQECKRLLQQFESKTGNTVPHIVSTGGVSATVGVQEYIQELFERQVVIAQPFEKVAYPAFMQDTLTQLGSSFAVSLGAALRQM